MGIQVIAPDTKGWRIVSPVCRVVYPDRVQLVMRARFLAMRDYYSRVSDEPVPQLGRQTTEQPVTGTPAHEKAPFFFPVEERPPSSPGVSRHGCGQAILDRRRQQRVISFRVPIGAKVLGLVLFSESPERELVLHREWKSSRQANGNTCATIGVNTLALTPAPSYAVSLILNLKLRGRDRSLGFKDHPDLLRTLSVSQAGSHTRSQPIQDGATASASKPSDV